MVPEVTLSSLSKGGLGSKDPSVDKKPARCEKVSRHRSFKKRCLETSDGAPSRTRTRDTWGRNPLL